MTVRGAARVPRDSACLEEDDLTSGLDDLIDTYIFFIHKRALVFLNAISHVLDYVFIHINSIAFL